MTLVVCPNLAVDRVLVTAALRPGHITRCRALSQQAGGKGANVARALRLLRGAEAGDARRTSGGAEGGGDAGSRHQADLLIGFAAGRTGELFAGLAAAEGLTVRLVPCAGEMRVSTVVLGDDETVTPLYELGPETSDADEAALADAIAARPAAPGEWAIVDGAVPPGARDGFYGALCVALRAAGYRVLVDAAGEQLAGALAARPDLIKVNFAEACTVVGTPGDCVDEELTPAEELAGRGLALCRRLVAAGAGEAAVTLGAAGSVAILGGAAWRVMTPPVHTRNSVGSGDCYAAALLDALERRLPAKAALAAAAGAGGANAASPLTGHFDLDLARELAGLACVGPPGP